MPSVLERDMFSGYSVLWRAMEIASFQVAVLEYYVANRLGYLILWEVIIDSICPLVMTSWFWKQSSLVSSAQVIRDDKHDFLVCTES